ncbi:hypothetical protein JEQ12_010111 [Ovis aries]|uniref:Uncharacterized protein n=1 Tax=Ovis aries TaxID=9940 RepID=A0A836D7H6_SHEEP|nr:hypothetical protein JEQ12_010111 [Ovis aries]
MTTTRRGAARSFLLSQFSISSLIIRSANTRLLTHQEQDTEPDSFSFLSVRRRKYHTLEDKCQEVICLK